MPGLPLAASGLRIAFAGDTIVDLPALELLPGSLTVLTGPSGSGKSTLLYLLSGLLRPDGGSVSWAGEDIARLGESRRDRWRREHAGFIFQNFHLIDEMSPTDNVLVPVWFDRLRVGVARQRAEKLLHDLDVPAARASAALLSRGQQHRVAIARALIGDPAVVFADEPTASLDARSGETVIATLRELASRDGRTVIVASHDPALRAVADRSVHLDHGRAAEAA